MTENGQTSPGSAQPSGARADSVSRKRWIIENVISLGTALLVVFMVRSSVVEAFKIPSGSMIPTLLVGDHIFVNKFAYGFQIPFSDWVTGAPVHIIKRDPPKRGDIIVFKYPRDESYYYIKRVVGVPGDTVEMREKIVYLNGKPVGRDIVEGPKAEGLFKRVDDPKYTAANLDLYIEHLDQQDHMILQNKQNFIVENTDMVTVPPEHLFVMGDNRDFSNDSRFWGFVPYKNVKGRAMVIWLSVWLDFSEGQYMFRPSRIGTVLHNLPSDLVQSPTH